MGATLQVGQLPTRTRSPTGSLAVLCNPATIPLSGRTPNHLAQCIRAHRKQRRSRWRRLDPGRQALLALAHRQVPVGGVAVADQGAGEPG
jgi:hypothetical protein